jgi:hypothetical protein
MSIPRRRNQRILHFDARFQKRELNANPKTTLRVTEPGNQHRSNRHELDSPSLTQCDDRKAPMTDKDHVQAPVPQMALNQDE